MAREATAPRASVTGTAGRCASRRPRACTGSGRAAGTAGPARTRPASGTSRYPPQCGGRGTSPPANRLRRLRHPSLELRAVVQRLGSGRSPTRRAARRAAASRSTRRTRPARARSTRPGPQTWRSSSRQKTVNAARGFSASSRALAALVVREEREAAGRRCRAGARGAPRARRRRRRSRARSRWQRDACGLGFGEPAPELLDRVGVEVGATERPCSWIGRRALHRARIGHGPHRTRRRARPDVPPAGLEPALPAPEAGTLSAELRGRGGRV